MNWEIRGGLQVPIKKGGLNENFLRYVLNHDRVLFSIREQRCGVANYEKDVRFKRMHCTLSSASGDDWGLEASPPVYQLVVVPLTRGTKGEEKILKFLSFKKGGNKYEHYIDTVNLGVVPADSAFWTSLLL
ncbi:MAG: hypothetical protein EDM70_15195 [Candidatus Brocadia sp. AMX2]|nr:MAG: hypothetical protein EDM70_15195 [Candidatus Brocadia sp. AMX2]